MPKEIKFNKPCRLHTQSISTGGISPFQPLASNQTRPVLFSSTRGQKWRGLHRSRSTGSGHLPTCSPALRAAQRGGTAPRQMTPCCSAARLRSPTLGCSCSATAGLAAGPWCWGGDTGEAPSVKRHRLPSATPYSYLGWKQEEVKPFHRLWLRGSSCLPKPVLLSSGRGEQKSILDVQPRRKHVVVTAQLGAPSSRPPTASNFPCGHSMLISFHG